MAHLGFTVDSSQATKATNDLDRLVASSGKAERGAGGVSRAYKDMQAALASINATLQSVERHTAVLASGMNQSAAATAKLDAATGKANVQLRAMDGAVEAAMREMIELRTASTGAATAINAEAAALRLLNDELRENASLPRPSGRPAGGVPAGGWGNQFNTANIAAQFQDIGVTAAMGMSPMQIALQQGTQLSAALGGQGLTATVKGLGAAFASIISPVSLLTIGVIGLGTYGVQALMSMMGAADDANAALERHEEWIERITRGYDGAADAAFEAADQAARLPQDLAQGELAASAVELQRQLAKEINDVAIGLQVASNEANRMTQLAGGLGAAGLEAARELDRLADSAADGSLNADELRRIIYELDFPDDVSESLRRFIQDLRVAAQEAVNVQSQIFGISFAAAELARNGGLQLALDEQIANFETALDFAKRSTPELRDTVQVLRDNLAVQLANGTLPQEALDQLTEATNAAIAGQEELERRRKAQLDARSGVKAFNAWETANDNFMQRIEQQRMEIDLIGKSTYEIERQRAAFELLNQAKQADVQITPELTDHINQMSAEYANLAVTMENVQRQADLAISINNTLAQGFADMFTGVITGSKSAEEAIANLLGQLGQLLINQAFMGLFGAGTSGGIGGMLAGIFGGGGLGAGGPGFLGGGVSAWGSWEGGGYTWDGPRTGGVDGRGGRFGILHPNETVIDHTRSSGAAMGIPANENAANVNFNMQATIYANSEEEGAAAARGWQREMARWQKSGEGAAFVRKVNAKPGRANP